MLVASSLRDTIVASIQQAGDQVPVFTYGKAIKDYIEANAAIRYFYTGTTPLGPDPLPGIYPAKVVFPNLQELASVKRFLSNLKTPDPNMFLQALVWDLTTVITLDTPLLTGPPATLRYTLVPSVAHLLEQAKDFQDNWLIMSVAIITIVKAAVGTQITTTSATPGTGVSSFISIL